MLDLHWMLALQLIYSMCQVLKATQNNFLNYIKKKWKHTNFSAKFSLMLNNVYWVSKHHNQKVYNMLNIFFQIHGWKY